MRKGILVALTVLTLSATTGSGQDVSSAPQLLPIRVNPPPSNATPVLWGGVDYLMWWSRGVNLPPLVAIGDPTDTVPGALGQPGTRVLLGGEQGFGMMSGMRGSLGGWFNGGPLGWEAAGFLFERRVNNFSVSSDAAGNPSLYYPIFRPDAGREGSISIADAVDGVAGRMTVTSQSRLWGSEANLLLNLGGSARWCANLVAGFRYLDLQEGIVFNDDFNDPIVDVRHLIRDSFSTRSQFYGGQFGIRLDSRWEKLSLNLTGKVALRSTHHPVDIRGTDTLSGTGAVNPGTYTEGILTQTSNIGRRTANDFTVVPQVQVKVGYDLLPRVRLTCAYDFLCWSQVVRAGEQIDHRVDVTQSNVFSPLAPAVTPASFPSADIRRSGYWAQGLGFGLEFRY